MTRRNTPRVTFIGFGEAGQAIASGLRETGIEQITAWDILFPDSAGAKLKSAGKQFSVRAASSAADAVHDADIIISAVTAASSLEAAKSVEPHLKGNPYYLDINSVSPGRKQETARLLDGKARYVDVAVIAPIHPARHRTPMLIAGPHAEAIMPLLEELDMKLKIVPGETGKAAAIKMIRSVMIKGLEAMVIESFTAARAYGVEGAVLASLQETFPGVDWEKQASYFFQRVIEHGRRRSEEVREVAETVREIGLTPWSAEGTAERQAWMADLADAGLFGTRGEPGFARSPDWRTEADRILASVLPNR